MAKTITFDSVIPTINAVLADANMPLVRGIIVHLKPEHNHAYLSPYTIGGVLLSAAAEDPCAVVDMVLDMISPLCLHVEVATIPAEATHHGYVDFGDCHTDGSGHPVQPDGYIPADAAA